ncbi:MAG: Integral membrane sensor signal transduction histidine kinase [Candidatus Falkowbacteria bacterium GW2011_GWC2_38_22]|uniref:histidine kinase n=1 Tax=Candidatus Falkowbacteria bacterium GW2011_GWE1_38_31 TaxID=1618638 RepID=A0A0G0JUD2_9BACT|nr:MAG: Integral membrane sensor signal transduction histidine kinase [Candidatus Falkowbacteria bacterium GW2011_GWF2_38_1205]KKQ61579.1 MAG: Integral membrane sensor signal transduction histidine kinase [Candidatus Falkowbacteria bacterium GW2011_GWC2_38_22]KKQ63528.1 MAG: Integral membrane sensor signal transduction histidine kinase [Candidatus Falkowbacteria bacterium GW2011_GWF1_38_22]KKQ65680.1 MAG: Integral membrane sensor signal transduction histidine kinase [Candidatus Falkowbacteria ba
MVLRIKLSDRILMIMALFASVFIIFSVFVFKGSVQQILILGAGVYIITFIATYVISWRFSSRIIKLTMGVEAMAAGDLTRKFVSRGNDEISQLKNSLNELVSRLHSGVAQDVTKHKELARAKTDFVALASHQLRTPLSIIKWYVDFLRTGDAGPVTEEQKKYLEQVYVSNERLIELVNALLDVSRIDVGTFSIEPEPTDIEQKADAALKKFMPAIESRGIAIDRRYDVLPIINLDPRLTKIVFENIFSNAVKYVPDKGTIRIEIKKTEADVLIKISDNGCGIPREQQPQVFTKLFRADNVRRIESIGTGLGLYIVKAIIEKSGGKIWFQSPSLEFLSSAEKKDEKSANVDGRGTTFFITIPLKGMKPRAGTKKLSSD